MEEEAEGKSDSTKAQEERISINRISSLRENNFTAEQLLIGNRSSPASSIQGARRGDVEEACAHLAILEEGPPKRLAVRGLRRSPSSKGNPNRGLSLRARHHKED